MFNFWRVSTRITYKSGYFLDNFIQNCQKKSRHGSQFKRSPILKLRDRNLTAVQDIILLSPHKLDDESWKKMRQQILEADRTVNTINIDAMIMGHLELDKAKSYISFLKNEGIKVNLATLGRILKLYYSAFAKNGSLPDEDLKDVVAISNTITSEAGEFVSASICENLILALCMTEDGKLSQAKKYLDMIKLSCNPSAFAYSAVVKAAFDHNESETGWHYMDEVVNDEKFPKCTTYVAWLDYSVRNRETCLANIHRMLHFVENNKIMLSEMIVRKLEKVLQQFDYKTSNSTITPKYQCSSCQRTLNELVVTNEDFYKVRDSFLEKVLIRKDVFLKSSPTEIERFLKFLDSNRQPYDIIIDGLNVAYSLGTEKPSSVYANLLSSVVEYFVKKDQNVLVLGRKHMNRWPNHQMSFIKKNATLFLTENLSQDDPFLLYAALKNGPNTCFISRDLMRSHAYLLGKELKPIFRRWQQARQYGLIFIGENGQLKLKAPAKYQMSVQRCGDSWHIPFSSEDQMRNANPVSTFEMPENWLCAIASSDKQ